MSRTLYIQAASRLLNPVLDRELVESAFEDDPESAVAEYGGMFRSDTSEFLADSLIDAAIVENRTELPYLSRYAYCAFVDVSGGTHDASALGIAHLEPGARALNLVLDQLISEKAPHSPHEAVAKFSSVLQRFNIRHVTGDRYGGGFVTDAFKHTGIRYEPSELDKSAIYREVAPFFVEKRIELLDDKKLITELRMLERKPRAGGRGDAVDHAPRSHDDLANACAGALWLASLGKARPAGNRTRPAYSIT